MKHLYTLVFAMLTMSVAFAQAPVREYAGRDITARPLRHARGLHPGHHLHERFLDCSNISFTNANDEGYTDYIDGINWECTTAGPSGPYAIEAINSATADNDFVLVDSDLFGAEENYAASWVENCWFNIDDAVGRPVTRS